MPSCQMYACPTKKTHPRVSEYEMTSTSTNLALFVPKVAHIEPKTNHIITACFPDSYLLLFRDKMLRIGWLPYQLFSLFPPKIQSSSPAPRLKEHFPLHL